MAVIFCRAKSSTGAHFSRATVDARLAEVEQIARSAGVLIAIGQAFPVTLERIRAWAATLEGKGIALVPISAVVDRQSDR